MSMTFFFEITAVIMAITSFLCLIRGVIGPSAADRIIVVNTIGTKAVVIMTLFAYIWNDKSYLDVALVYALASFIVTISVAKYKKEGKLF